MDESHLSNYFKKKKNTKPSDFKKNVIQIGTVAKAMAK
jgi:hypothetical protein